jgi:deoxyadenosine/deoxycytidine kinase
MKIAVGGMIASGKTTLIHKLSEALPHYMVLSEYRKDDPLFDELLRLTYEGVEDAGLLLQIYFIQKHWKSQQEHARVKNLIMDRHLIEHWLFSHNRLNDPVIWQAYNTIFQNFMMTSPTIDLYLILDVDWETFKERIYRRNRAAEIENFEQNEKYFYDLLSSYTEKLVAQCIIYDIPYEVINTSGLQEHEVFDLVSKVLFLDSDV